MCTKKCFRMPTLVIFGVILTIVLVFITGITLTNSINISNIVKLREKVASDSAAANSANAAQTRAALVEQQYSTLQQHHLSRSDLNYITANHPKNLQRFLQTQQQQQQQQQTETQQTPLQHLPLMPAHGSSVASSSNSNNNNKIIIEIGIRNFTAAAAAAAVAQQQQQQLLQANNRSLSSSATNASADSNLSGAATGEGSRHNAAATIVEQLVAPFDGAIIDGNIESISVPATSEIRQQLNETLKYLAENDKTVTSVESKNSLMLNRLPPVNNDSNNSSSLSISGSSNTTLKPLNSNSNKTSSGTRTNSTVSSSSSSASSLVASSLKSFLNNSLNSSTSSNNNNNNNHDNVNNAHDSSLVNTAAVSASSANISKETILFSILSTTTASPKAISYPTTTTTKTTTESFSSFTTTITPTAAPNQLSIEDHNPGMIDFEKRNYVKKVKYNIFFFGFLHFCFKPFITGCN